MAAHDIQGIGDKHVTWIHNVLNMDAIMCLDDIACKKGLQLLTEPAGQRVLVERYGAPAAMVERLSTIFGISGVCNVLGAIKTAKHYRLGPSDVIATICTDAIDRYHSVMDGHAPSATAPSTKRAARPTSNPSSTAPTTDWIKDGTPDMRRQWHNLKYYTWVEQQGKTVEELDAQMDPRVVGEPSRAGARDRRADLKEAREA